MLPGVFVVVIEAQKLEVCIHKQLHGWKAKWISIHKHEWWCCQYFHHNLWDPTKNTQQPSRQKFQLYIWSQITYMLLRLNMHVASEKPLN